MAAVFAFLGILAMSIVAAVLAALQLGDYFMASDELAYVIAGLVVFAIIALMALVLTYRLARGPRALNAVAALLAAAAIVLVFVPGLVPAISSHSTNPYAVGYENTAIAIELAVPALIAVLVQWGLVRRRFLRNAGEDDLTLWPWVTTVIGGLVILNPLGLAIFGAALRRSATDVLWDLWTEITAGIVAVLVVMALIECYIRRRIMRRRAAAAPPGVTAGAQV